MDLPGEVIHLYQQARDVATAMGKIQFLRPAVLSQIIGDFGEHGLHCVERWCARPMTSIDTLQNMCEGKEPLVFTKPQIMKAMVNETPGRERRFEPAPKAPTKKRLPDGWMKRENAIAWMRDNHPNDMDIFDEYFQDMGYSPEHDAQIFLLQTSSRQQTT